MLTPARRLTLMSPRQRVHGFETPLSMGSDLAGWWKKGVGRYESSDESDPADTNGNAIRRWSDQSAAGNHLLQATADIRPARYEDYVSCYWRTEGTDKQAFMACTLASTISRNAVSGGAVVDAPNGNLGPLVAFGPSAKDFALAAGTGSDPRFVAYHNGAALPSTSLHSSGRRMVLVWSLTAAATKIWVNGTLFTGAGLADETLETFRIGSFAGGSPKSCRIVEAFIASRAMTDSEAAGANTYLRTVAGPLATGTGKVITIGDSISAGCGSDLMLPWMYRVTNRADSHEWRCYNVDGGTSQTPPVSAANVAAMVTTGDVVVWWLGANDIISNARTGAQVFAECDAYRTTIMATGAKFIAPLLQDMSANDTEAQAFNTLLAAAAGDFSAVADIRAALPDCTNTTLFTDDQIHPKDAGHAAAATAIQTAMASV